MIYLIGQLWFWLALTAGFAALAGWALAAERALPAEQKLLRRRETLMADVLRLGLGEGSGETPESEREVDALRRMLELRDARIAALERAEEDARARAAEATCRLAELERAAEPEEVIENLPLAEAAPETELRNWRLRYFEQRVTYLESRARPEPPTAEWRAREAQARAAHLEQEVRKLAAPAPEPAFETPPFAADAEVDILLRWRLLYLERRAAHFQLSAPAATADSAAADRLKWRARYLEARLRHYEQRQAPGAEPQPVLARVGEAARSTPLAAVEKPRTLPAARDGGPDDFTLIEDVSAMQQSTLYSIGVFHFDQIAAWSPGNIAWVDQYLRLRGRIDEEQWLAQAADLARDGVAAARRAFAEEDA